MMEMLWQVDAVGADLAHLRASPRKLGGMSEPQLLALETELESYLKKATFVFFTCDEQLVPAADSLVVARAWSGPHCEGRRKARGRGSHY